MRVSIVLVLLVASSVWRTALGTIVFGSAGSELVLCGEDAQNACPQCCDEEGNCNFEGIDTDTACKPSGGIDCDNLCPSSSSKTENDDSTKGETDATSKPTPTPELTTSPMTDAGNDSEDGNSTQSDESKAEMPVSDAGANAVTVVYGADGISVCGVLLKDLCPECCDGDDCNFSTLSFTECPDPKSFDCSTICVIRSSSNNENDDTTKGETDATSKPTPTPERTNTSLDNATTEVETNATSKPTSTPELTASPMTDAGNDSEDGNSTQSGESKAAMPSISKTTQLITLSLGIFGMMGLLQ